MKYSNELDLKIRIWSMFIFFALALSFGVMSMSNVKFIASTLIFLSFLCYNGFMLLYKIIILATKKILVDIQNKK